MVGIRRPYKTWITTPLIFCGVCLARVPLPVRWLMFMHQVCVFLLSMPIKAAPTQALAALVFILAGVPVYYMTQREEPDPVAGGIVGTSRWSGSVAMLTVFTSMHHSFCEGLGGPPTYKVVRRECLGGFDCRTRR